MINVGAWWSWSIFSPVEVPQKEQTYSYLLPEGRTSSNRSRAGVASLQFGQNRRVAFSERNWAVGSACGCPGCGRMRMKPGTRGPKGVPAMLGSYPWWIRWSRRRMGGPFHDDNVQWLALVAGLVLNQESSGRLADRAILQDLMVL